MSGLKFTTIQHDFRKKNNLTCNEYILADMIHFLSTHPSSKVKGWCYKSRPSLASDIGVSKQSVLNILKALELKGFILKDQKTNYLKSTEKWFVVYFIGGQDSLPPSQESLPLGGQKSLPNNNNIDNNIKETNSIDTESEKNSVLGTNKLFEDQKKSAYSMIVDFWMKDFHPDFYFSATSGKKLKSIITKIKALLVKHNDIQTDDRVADFFKMTCHNLPDFYKNKDLDMIDSKFNEIVQELKKNKNGITKAKPISKYQPAV